MSTTTDTEIDITYRVPVSVIVDIETGEVTRVRVMDESIEEWATYAASPGERDAMTRAYEIAAEADWPAWEIG